MREWIFGVSEFIAEVRTVFAQAFGRVWVEGEVAGLYRSRPGHVYFDLKDESGLLKAVMFRRSIDQSALDLAEGMQVRVRAAPEVYPARGQLQLIVDRVEAAGEGALRAAFERLKQALEAEGLFDPGYKRPLPYRPRRVGLVTSLGGAAIHDFVRALRRRRAGVEVVVYDARVQGPEAWRELVRGMNLLASDASIEAIVLARGGGSLEDLWSFNREELVRAIFALETPVVSAVGHETDFVLSDFVADVRAATPTAAAEYVSPPGGELLGQLSGLARRLERAHAVRLASLRERLRGLERGLVHPRERLRGVRLRLRAALASLDKLGERLPRRSAERLRAAGDDLRGRIGRNLLRSPEQRIDALRIRLDALGERLPLATRQRLDQCRAQLDALSPLRVLARGYGIARRERDHAILRSSREIEVGEAFEVILSAGSIRAAVSERREDE